MPGLTSMSQEPKTLGGLDAHEFKDVELVSSRRTNSISSSDGGYREEIEKAAAQGADKKEVDPFAHNENAAIDYKTMEWYHAGLLMLAETISLGVLALPSAVASVGILPGMFLIFALGGIATYTGYVIGQFKLKHINVVSFADAGYILAGRVGREVMEVAAALIFIFIMAAHILSFSIAMNALTNHAQCTIIYGFIGFIICLVLSLPRTLKSVSYLSATSCVSVVAAVTLAMVCIAIKKPNMNNMKVVNTEKPFADGMASVLTMILAYAGHVAFFGICGEMKKPEDFPKAMTFMTVSSATFYMIISAVIYYYAGPGVMSPALGSATPIVKKICWGLAMPTIIVAGVVNAAICCKTIYLRIWKGTTVYMENSFKAIGSWVAICASTWFIAWLIAEAVPNFNLLLGLISALFCSWFSYGITGALWLHMNKGRLFSTKTKTFLTIVNCLILCLGATICVLGLYTSAVEIKHGKARGSFSCANNDTT